MRLFGYTIERAKRELSDAEIQLTRSLVGQLTRISNQLGESYQTEEAINTAVVAEEAINAAVVVAEEAINAAIVAKETSEANERTLEFVLKEIQELRLKIADDRPERTQFP